MMDVMSPYVCDVKVIQDQPNLDPKNDNGVNSSDMYPSPWAV